MKSVFLSNVAIAAPGLASWDEAAAVLRGETPYHPEPLPPLSPALLPANERRRATATIKLVLHTAGETLRGQPADAQLQCVFASSVGDSDITDRLCRALASPDRPVSPTHFHNSVHNAPAGYFSIAVSSRAPSISIAADRATFAAGLLEAASQVLVERQPALLIAYDSLPPDTLRERSGITREFALGLLLTPQPVTESRWELAIGLNAGTPAPRRWDDPALAELAQANPIGNGLGFFAALARGEPSAELAYLAGQHLTVDIQPCG